MLNTSLISCRFRQLIFLWLFTCSIPFFSDAQEKLKITGVITNNKNEAVPFATVFVQEWKQHATTNEKGGVYFEVNNNKSIKVLHIKIWAFGFQKIDTNLVWNYNKKKNLNFKLSTEVIQLKEVTIRSVQIKPLLKKVLKVQSEQYNKKGYYANILASRHSVHNKYAVEEHLNIKGEVYIPKKAYSGATHPETKLESFYIHKRVNPRGIRVVGTVNYTTEKAYQIFSFFKAIRNSEEYEIRFDGFTDVNNQTCYHIVYTPKTPSNKQILYSGYFDIDTVDLAITRFYKEFELNQKQNETSYKYNLGFLPSVLFGTKGFLLGEIVSASFKKHNNTYVLDEAHYMQKILVINKRGGKEYLSLKNKVNYDKISGFDEVQNFEPTPNKFIPNDSIPKYEDNTFWERYFEESSK
jgi:hypothetical protein